MNPQLCLRVCSSPPYPIGVTWTAAGVNVAIVSEHATTVQLCVCDSPGDTHEATRNDLAEQTDMARHGFLPGSRPSQLYGYRVHGPYERSHNLCRIVMDPYAKPAARTVRWADEMCVAVGPERFMVAIGTAGSSSARTGDVL